MGREAHCLARHGGRESLGRALLETDGVIFRGEFRLMLPLKAITAVRAEGDWLTIEHPDGPAELKLGEREASRWANAIANPKRRIDKLGVKPGQTAATVGELDSEFLAELRERAAEPTGPADLIFYAIATVDDLERLGPLQQRLARDGAIWVIRPKGRKDVSESAVMAAARSAGLVDVKVVRFSDTHTAEKFVIPVQRR